MQIKPVTGQTVDNGLFIKHIQIRLEHFLPHGCGGCSSGASVSWSISTAPDAQLVNTMLEHAVVTLPDTAPLFYIQTEAAITVGQAGSSA